MFPLMTATPMSPTQVVAATRLLLAIAHVDEARTAEEVELIHRFYDACAAGEAGFPPFDSLAAGAEGTAAGDFPDEAHRDMLLALCLMVAYADGELSTKERKAVTAAADRLRVSDARLGEILGQVKDHMLAQLSRLPDAGSVATVARELA